MGEVGRTRIDPSQWDGCILRLAPFMRFHPCPNAMLWPAGKLCGNIR